jgi:hypothetical protein
MRAKTQKKAGCKAVVSQIEALYFSPWRAIYL